MATFDNANLIKQYNNKDYYMELKISSPDGIEWTLTPQSILYLEIENDLQFWPVRGFFVYENPHESLNRTMSPPSELNGSVNANTAIAVLDNKPYIFRNDGRDFLSINIYLVDTENKFPKDKWVLNYKCVIYDQEDMQTDNIAAKAKKFYFWDADYQKMLEQKIQWSTATSTLNTAKRTKMLAYDPAQATDEERQMTTGDAVKSILTDNGFKCSSEFDRGSTKLFYSTYADKNIWNNIDYILQQHMSEKSKTTLPLDDSDICLFLKNSNTQEFELIPLTTFFERAGNTINGPKEYSLELSYLEEAIGEANTSPNKAPYSKELNYEKGYIAGLIRSYEFVDMAGDVNTHLIVTTPVHAYDFKNKTFSINMANSNTDVLYEKIKSKYIQNKVVSKGSYPLVTLNQNKTDNINIRPVYSVRSDKDAIAKKGIGSLLNWSLFLNECLRFETSGLPLRRAGRFLGIDRMSFSDNEVDYKLLGQWFTTNVKHKFWANGTYMNEVIAVKLYSYDDLGIDQKAK